jgi:hypothetical protein
VNVEPGGQLRVLDELAQPPEVDGGEDGALDGAPFAQDRVRHVQRGLAGHTADLVVPHREPAGRHRPLEVRPVAERHIVGGRQRAANQAPALVDRPEVEIEVVLPSQVGQDRPARRRVAPADLGQPGQGDEQVPGAAQAPSLLAGRQPGQPDRGLLGEAHRLATLLEARVDDEPEGGHDRDGHDRQQPRAEALQAHRAHHTDLV